MAKNQMFVSLPNITTKSAFTIIKRAGVTGAKVKEDFKTAAPVLICDSVVNGNMDGIQAVLDTAALIGFKLNAQKLVAAIVGKCFILDAATNTVSKNTDREQAKAAREKLTALVIVEGVGTIPEYEFRVINALATFDEVKAASQEAKAEKYKNTDAIAAFIDRAVKTLVAGGASKAAIKKCLKAAIEML